MVNGIVSTRSMRRYPQHFLQSPFGPIEIASRLVARTPRGVGDCRGGCKTLLWRLLSRNEKTTGIVLCYEALYRLG